MCIPAQESRSYTTVNNEILYTTMQESSYISVKNEIAIIIPVQESYNSLTLLNKISDKCT